MSREQWGHGYWKGVSDAQAGDVKQKVNIEKLAYRYIGEMTAMNEHKSYDRSLFSVSFFIAMCDLDGALKYAKRIYDYILRYHPCGCYVSGDSWDEWTDDYFVICTRDEFLKEIEEVK